MKRGLLDFPHVAKKIRKSLGWTYQLHHLDPDFPPVERIEDGKKYFDSSAIEFYRDHVRARWYRPHMRGK
jgi:hypothetical protein